MLGTRNLSLIPKNTPSHFAGDSASCRICLSVKKRDKAGKCKRSEKRYIGFYRGEKQGKNVGLSRCRMKVSTICILIDLFGGV